MEGTNFQRYLARKKAMSAYTWNEVKKHKMLYLFLFPFLLIFATFTLAPVGISLGLSFTYFNVLEPPRWIGFTNYLNLFLSDDIFIIALRNTIILATITGPVGFMAAFLFAWFINELPRFIRAFVTLVFYAPTIAGSAYLVWLLIFSGDSMGHLNAYLMRAGIINSPILWLTNPDYMMYVIIIVVLWMSLGAGFLAFIAGLSTIDEALYEAGLVDGVRNRWQELWFITLPNMQGMLLFGAVMAITSSFAVGEVTQNLAGFPSTDYEVHTIVNHLVDYGAMRFEMGYASAIATILFISMIYAKRIVSSFIGKIGR
ncbi:MAG: sugar ABC transporter permease [Clostridiales bacterium]|jgi:multiple sugar transport system permease protein|nr:sugar ABC transporter permease [Clostridiales bacterium]